MIRLTISDLYISLSLYMNMYILYIYLHNMISLSLSSHVYAHVCVIRLYL